MRIAAVTISRDWVGWKALVMMTWRWIAALLLQRLCFFTSKQGFTALYCRQGQEKWKRRNRAWWITGRRHSCRNIQRHAAGEKNGPSMPVLKPSEASVWNSCIRGFHSLLNSKYYLDCNHSLTCMVYELNFKSWIACRPIIPRNYCTEWWYT